MIGALSSPAFWCSLAGENYVYYKVRGMYLEGIAAINELAFEDLFQTYTLIARSSCKKGRNQSPRANGEK
jgi:hypothetical protein